VNRSRRRAAVISWAITAGVLYGGVGLVGVAPAAADPAATEPSSGTTDGPRSHTTGKSAARSPRVGQQALGVAADDGPHHRGYPRRGAGRVPPGGIPAEGAEPAERPWPCHIIWPVLPVPVVPVIDAAVRSNTIIFGLAPVGPPVPPLAILSGAVDPASLEVRIARRIARTRDVANSGLPQPAAAEPPRFRRSMTPADAVPLAGPGTPPVAPAPQRPEAGGGSPQAGPAGYPESRRDADFAEVAVVALPGLAGIVGITALGGFLGYRQAKVGYILRAAGSARFLQ